MVSVFMQGITANSRENLRTYLTVISVVIAHAQRWPLCQRGWPSSVWRRCSGISLRCRLTHRPNEVEELGCPLGFRSYEISHGISRWL